MHSHTEGGAPAGGAEVVADLVGVECVRRQVLERGLELQFLAREEPQQVAPAAADGAVAGRGRLDLRLHRVGGLPAMATAFKRHVAALLSPAGRCFRGPWVVLTISRVLSGKPL